jgi:hypothetical protein
MKQVILSGSERHGMSVQAVFDSGIIFDTTFVTFVTLNVHRPDLRRKDSVTLTAQEFERAIKEYQAYKEDKEDKEDKKDS